MVELLWNSRATLVLLSSATALAADVWAHATLVRSAPADGAILAEAPQEVRLWFDENISPRSVQPNSSTSKANQWRLPASIPIRPTPSS